MPGNIIPRYLLGVRPLEPGFKKVLIRPQPAGLARASGTVPTIRGPVGVTIKSAPGAFTLTVDLPVNMTARVGMPQINPRSTSLWLDGNKVAAELRDGVLYVDGIGSGAHVLVAK